MTLFLQREATHDLEDATHWYENQLPGLGNQFINETYNAFDRIEENPSSCPVVYKHPRRPVMRRFPFCVFFTLDDDQIHVVGVLHGSRNPQRWQSRA
ncbi:MAG: type II toxin-antitoxin system RelE/ParE family toxin [bacterium]